VARQAPHSAAAACSLNGHETVCAKNGALNNQHTKPRLQSPVLFRFIGADVSCGALLRVSITRDCLLPGTSVPRGGIAQKTQFRHLIAALTTATCPFYVRRVQIGSFLAILKQTYRKTDLMRASEQQMDARIGIFGSFGGIECMSEPFDHMEYRSYLKY